jgi:MCP family monocarboxylic acid transporter-like MFS transporter 14
MGEKKVRRKENVPVDVAVPIPPDGGYGWVVLIASFVSVRPKMFSKTKKKIFILFQFVSFICDGCMYSFGIILTHIKNDFNASQGLVNLISSFNTGFIFMSGPAIAGFANQFGIRPVIMAGSVVGASMFVLAAFSPNIYFVMASFGFVGGWFNYTLV